MRSIETLVKSYPDLTGREILALQERDKREDERQYNERHRKKLDFIADMNKNRAFFKGRFGKNQYYYRNLTCFNLDEIGNIKCDVESIVGFPKDDDPSLKLNLGITSKDNEYYDRYLCHSTDTRITKNEYMALRDYYISSFEKFWGNERTL